jgi:hypothetical protein
MDHLFTQTIQPGSMRTITENKLATFAVGQQKKSRFQKAREDKETKKKMDDEAAALEYDKFVATFSEVESSKTFVRGGKVNDDGRDEIYGGGNRGDVYKLERKNQAGHVSERDQMLEEFKVINNR